MAEKKKILFVMNNLNVGGAEKALVSLLNELDFTKYEVDLLLFKNEGVFLSQVPQQVNLLKKTKNYHFFDGPFSAVLRTFNPRLIFARYWFKKLMQKGKTTAEAEQYSWKALQLALPKLSKKYDVAIGYLEKNPIYYIVDKVVSKRKIGFIHNDYVSLGLNKQIDLPYFEKLNSLCTISAKCQEVLFQEFPVFQTKIHLIPNVVSRDLLMKKANELVTETYWISKMFNIVSIGRLEKQKGFELSINVAKILKDKGVEFRWYIFGEGSLKVKLENLIKGFDLQEEFILAGLHLNPVKFMNQADIIVQTSLFEGKSIVIDEAKMLCKPILITNYPTAKDQIKHHVTGVISEMNPESIAEDVINLKESSALRNKLTINLEIEISSPENGISKFLKLL